MLLNEGWHFALCIYHRWSIEFYVIPMLCNEMQVTANAFYSDFISIVFSGDGFIACNQIQIRLKAMMSNENNTTLKQWHSNPVNLEHYSIGPKWKPKILNERVKRRQYLSCGISPLHSLFSRISSGFKHFQIFHVISWQWWMQIQRLALEMIIWIKTQTNPNAIILP